jgi:type IV fimbrial biogenesis protein FimT
MLVTAMERSRLRGFTLIELLVTIAVVAIFSMLAGPAFRELIAAQRVKSGASALTESLWLARSEAVKRNADDVSFTLTAGVAKPWSITAGAQTLHVQEGFANVTSEVKSGGGTFTFNRYGRLTAGAGKVEFGVTNVGVYRCVTVSVAGRTTVEEGECS